MATNPVKMMPHSIEAEQSLLSCLLIDNNVVSSITEKIKPQDFYSEAHKKIYEIMYSLYETNQPIDFVTVVDKLEKQNLINEVGGIDYLTLLASSLPSAVNFKSYIDIVKRDSLNRALISAGQKIIEKAYEGGEIQDSIAFAEKMVYDIAQKEETSTLEHISVALNEAMKSIDELAKNGGQIKGISTGITEFDKLTNGLQNSDLILLAARPGVGKTSFAMNIAINAATTQHKNCAIFSLEMPRVQLAMRSLCQVAKVSMSKAKKGNLTTEEMKYIWMANKTLAESGLYVSDSSLVTPMDVLDKCRRLKREKGLDLIVIDYLQLMSSGKTSKDDNRQQEISQITRFLKIAAKELNVPIILLSQLSRAIEQRKDHKPMLSDLRESGAIEQDADIVLFIDNPDKYNDIVNPNEPGICELVVAKHRNGELANIKMRWIGELTTFIDPDKKIDRKDYGDKVKVVSDDAFGEVPDFPPDEDLSGLDINDLTNVFDDKNID